METTSPAHGSVVLNAKMPSWTDLPTWMQPPPVPGTAQHQQTDPLPAAAFGNRDLLMIIECALMLLEQQGGVAGQECYESQFKNILEMAALVFVPRHA